MRDQCQAQQLQTEVWKKETGTVYEIRKLNKVALKMKKYKQNKVSEIITTII